MSAKPVIDLFSEGGPVMIVIAGLSVLAWYLALRAWWQSRYHLAWLGRMRTDVKSVSGGASAEPHVQFVIQAQATRLGRAVRTLGALATLLPLLGLLGTVLGMLASFEVIQIHGTGQPQLLAGGIGQALMTTQAGLLAAVPILFFHHVIRTHVRQISTAMELLPRSEATVDERSER